MRKRWRESGGSWKPRKAGTPAAAVAQVQCSRSSDVTSLVRSPLLPVFSLTILFDVEMIFLF